MKKLLTIITLLLISSLLVGCINNSTKKANNNVDTIKKEIKNIDENLKYELPLGIDSIKLMKSGKVILVTSNDTISKEETTISLNVKDIYIFTFGNGGYRSVLLLKNDGTVSALNSSTLIENKQIEIIDNLGNLTNVTYIKQEKDMESRLIYAVLENGKEEMLDEYLK